MASDARDGIEPRAAESLFAEFLERAGREPLSFESFLAEHLPQADALRALYSLHRADADDAGPSADRTVDDGALTPLLPRPARGAPTDDGFQALLPGDRVGGYKVLAVIGQGGFGIVYRAEQEQPIRRTVALKILKIGMETREVLARFEAERQALALMSHPSIAHVFDAGVTDKGRPYFVMEHIDGVPITDYCERHDLGVRGRLELFLPVCEAVQHAHHKAVIHRDLKPSNVLVTVESGRPLPKVIDFGLAKALTQRLTEQTVFSHLGQLIGTPAYMSPEQAGVSDLDVDTRADIYSLGALLYELLTGALPLDLEVLRVSNYAELQRVIREEEPPRPSSRVSRLARKATGGSPRASREGRARSKELRGDLDWIVMKAMAKDRTRRYGTAAEFAADIRRHLAHEPVQAGPPGVWYRLRKLARRHRTGAALAGTVLALLCAFGAALKIRSEASYAKQVAAARSALAGRDAAGAQAALAVLLETYPGRATVKALARDVASLERTLLAEESAAFLERAGTAWQAYLAANVELRKREHEWTALRLEQPIAAPPWERGREFKVYDAVTRLRKEAEDSYDEAMLCYGRAVEIAPRDSEASHRARTEAAQAYKTMYGQAVADGSVAFKADFFKRRGAELDPAAFAKSRATVAFAIEPPDAEIYCFRYREYEKRLVPLPFDPSARDGEAGESPGVGPWLQIESASPGAPFEAGDRLRAVAGRPVRLWGEFAEALAGVEPDVPIPLNLVRAGAATSVSWVPYPRTRDEPPESSDLPPGRVVNTRDQFGFLFCAFPLSFDATCRIASGTSRGHAAVPLPEGSYLFVFRCPGYAEMRYPLAVARDDMTVATKLRRDGEIPPGFVYIPPGPFICGGDPDAFQSLPLGAVHVEGFCIGRFEVTIGEYAAFLNDPLSPIEETGQALPRSPYVIAYVQKYLKRQNGPDTVDLLPRVPSGNTKTPLFVREDPGGAWTAIASMANDRLPIFGVSNLAAREYAHWLTERQGGGRGVRFRLPTDLEWEKAARGVDRRHFVWGDYPLWYYSWTYRGIYRTIKGPEVVGITPADESVYGVRDLTGSVSEHTSGQPCPPYLYEAVRGGNWDNTDESFARAATRNGLYPHGSARGYGFRLVAEFTDQ